MVLSESRLLYKVAFGYCALMIPFAHLEQLD